MKNLPWGALCFAAGFSTALLCRGSDPCITPVINDSPAREPVRVRRMQKHGLDHAESLSVDEGVFPESISKVFQGYSTVPRDEFNQLIDVGVPLDKTTKGAEDVLVLYTNDKTLPNSDSALTAEDALENCDTVKVVLQDLHSDSSRQCFAILPQWESYHVHKFMRVSDPIKGTGHIDMKKPLSLVARTHSQKGKFDGYFDLPSLEKDTTPFYNVLLDYLQNLDRALDELKPFLENVMEKATDPGSNTLVVMTSNIGQSMLLRNFVCNARAKGAVDLSHVVVIATDKATLDLCNELGLAAWFDEPIFGSFPEEAAGRAGDTTFVRFSMAKIYCVHLVLSLGYNVLHQDIDIVWNRNPLPFFDSPEMEGYDMIFQDDGDRRSPGKPFNPNSGFHFIRNNDLTVFLYGMFIRMGDVVTRKSSHQDTLNVLLNEHVNWKGLRVKVIRMGDGNPFPGGKEFKYNYAYMKQMINNEIEPFIFHMSFTKSKEYKLANFKQLGEWYLKEDEYGSCSGGLECCLPEPNITCYYRDLPSKVPCRESPPFKKGAASFW